MNSIQDRKIVAIDKDLHKKIKELLKKRKKIKFASLRQFVDLAILEKLEKEIEFGK